jgi:hypothetical protein
MSSAGVDTEQAIQAHSTQFYSQFNSNLADKDHTAYPMPDEMLIKITDFLLQIKDGSSVSQLKKEHPHGYRFINIFDVILSTWWRGTNLFLCTDKSPMKVVLCLQ